MESPTREEIVGRPSPGAWRHFQTDLIPHMPESRIRSVGIPAGRTAICISYVVSDSGRADNAGRRNARAHQGWTMDPRFEHVRDLFPISRQRTFLFAGNFAPCATPVRDAIERYIQLWTDEGDACWAAGREAYEECRRLFARLIGAEPREVVGIPNTSTGIAAVAHMLSIPNDTNLVVGASDHPANIMPWLPMRDQGAEIGAPAKLSNGPR